MKEKKFCPGFIKDIIRQCKSTPDRIAFTDGKDRNSTYADFYDCIKRTCGYIKANNIPPKSFIVIALPNCMEYFAIEFGAWLSGCAIVPVSPLYPKARIDFITGHCEAKVVVTEEILEDIKVSTPLEIENVENDIAAIFYTSGSTGTPKGVIHTFESLSRIDHFAEIGEVDGNSCFSYGSPMSFIAFIMNIPFLRAGGRVRLFDRETMADVRLLQEHYDKDGITAIFLSPSLLKQISLKGNKSIKLVLVGGERISDLVPESDYKLVGLYGMTETTGPAFTFDIKKPYSNTPVGKPMSDVEMKLTDEGEICMRGPLTPGYFRDPERSASLWQGGWLHTGDIGKLLPDGNIQFVNRKDWMCKINGQRVETGEITQVIKEMECVKEAVAKCFTKQDGRQYIVAYYSLNSEAAADSIKSYLQTKLPDYMIPSYFVKMERFPSNMNGKIDIKSLQSPLEFGQEERNVAKPETELQKVICKAFETALGISPIGIDDDFFSMGGDSIRVMQLQNLCPEIELTASIIYRFRTPEKIAGAIENGSESTMESDRAKDKYNLSRTQEGIWIESMSHRGEVAYNNPMLYKLSGRLDTDKLAAACEAAVKIHSNLFAKIEVDENGIPWQKPQSSDSFHIEVENVTDAAFGRIRANLVQPFDLLNDRLFRIRIFKTPKSKWLFTDFHHIVFDGTSNEILIEDIENAYKGKTIEPEKVTGFEIAASEELLRRGDFLEECRQWNLDNFSDIDHTTLPDPDIFSDKITFATLEQGLDISEELFAKTAYNLGVTENILATAAFGYMLGACSHAKSAAFATVYNGRKELRTDRTVSMMVKTLPVSLKWDVATTMGELLRNLKNQMTGSMAHDLYSFAEICSNTCFDSRVLFTWQDELLERQEFCDEPCQLVSLQENATGEPLAVQLYKKNGLLQIRAEYRSNMFSKEYISQLISCFTEILHSSLQCEKNTPTTELQLVSENELKKLISIGKGKELDFDRNLTIVDLFRNQVKRRADATAVVDEGGSITYEELDLRSEELANELIASGIDADDFVAVMMPRSREFPISYIACFKCGAAYIPMDYEYPVERLQYMIEDCQAKVLLTTRSVFEQKCKEGELKAGKVIFVEDIRKSAGKRTPVNRAKPCNLAYMIYTSGTTGKPKGVMIEHHSLMNLVHWMADAEKVGPGTRIAEHASFSFDGSIIDLMTPLAFGGELHILPAELRKDLGGLYRYLCDKKIDGITLTTQLGMTLLKMYDLQLKYLIVGGEKFSGKYDTKIHIYNGYGPTEFTVCSSCYLLDNSNIPDNIPIGKALPNTISAVVDSLGRALPAGVPGELVLIGPQLARGYWHREDITAQRFVPCSFVPHEKMYRTGDLVRWDENGDLLYMGRIDTQVKLRGFRIELGEIESTIANYPGIRTAVVAIKEIGGMQHLCGYYCCEEKVDNEKLRAHCASTLTDYMVPTAFVQMEAMPMTPNGKVDIKSLPVPEIKADEIILPEGETESRIFDIVAQTLGNSNFGVTTNLISMGMTSLGAISLSVQIEKKTGLSIPSSKMLATPTIREWAKLTIKEEILEFEAQEVYPLTENQVGIYLDWEQHRDSLQYNVPLVFRFNGIGAERVKDAVDGFLSVHPYLKTRLNMIDGQVRQCRRDDDKIQVPVVPLPEAPGKEFFQQKMKPFNLLNEPLCRFSIFTFGNDTYLFTDIHHIIFDGGSESILAVDLVNAIKGEPLKKEKISAFDYALFYDNWKSSDAYSQDAAYFASILEGTSPADLPSPDGQRGQGAGTVMVDIARKGINDCCRKTGVTENAFFLTAVTQVLHRFSREKDISLVTVSNGRSLSALEHTAGMFVQTLPVVSHLSSRTVSEALQSMHRQSVESIARDKYPFTKIVERHGLKPNIMVVYQGGVMEENLCIDGKAIDITPLELSTAKFPISVNITPHGEIVQMQFEYDRALYSEKDVTLFADCVKAFAENILAADATSDINSIPCVTEEQSIGIIARGSGEKIEFDKDETIVKLFHKQVIENPENTAVVDSDSRMTYAELDRMSDIMAGKLLAEGVGNEDFVALMMPRCKEYAIAFMGVFKAGGAYIPMDSEYPADRLQYMLEDSKARVLVTTHSIFETRNRENGIKAEKVIFVDEMDFSAKEIEQVDNTRPEGLAYMIYTSGTTGKPKGVMIEHHSLVNFCHWHSRLNNVTKGTRVAQFASFSFDASIVDLMPTLAFGGELHILSDSIRKDPEQIHNYLDTNKIECAAISTQLGMMLLNSYDLKLRFLEMGGEKLTGKYDTSVRIVNAYGPTEFTICSSYYELERGNTPDNIPIGKAVPNTISAIVDCSGNLLPAGVAGELVLAGVQLARGYWNREDTTAQRFVSCPFLKGEKMYHTGDLARYDENGNLLYMGRIDTQVKLRGFRIELGEIESVIGRYEGVTATVAQVREIGGVQHLCAYYTATVKIDEGEMKKYVSSFLTGYMVPDSIMQLDELPLTPNGKIDTKALPEPKLADKPSEAFEAPEGEVEIQIAEAFAEVLGLTETLSRNSSFFLIGGTSLLVMKVIVKLSSAGFKVTYSDVYKYPTPRTLAAFLDGVNTASQCVTEEKADIVEKNEENATITKGPDGYDYTAINSILKSNTVEEIGKISSLEANGLGDVLLLGSTGYLGIHILHELITREQGKIYLVIRQKKGVTCEGRIKSFLMYYFDNTYNSLFGERISILEGDMTDDDILEKLEGVNADTVINCAANVKHFAAGDEIEKINLLGAQRMVEYCLTHGCRLIHTSTHSISGSFDSGAPHFMGENELFFGQQLMTKYQQSKFQAERAILEAVADKGLKAKIMRLGNLMPRYCDGEFQINLENNGFMARMRAYYLIGCIASSHIHTPLEFAPIDETASAVLTLARTPDKFTVFHPFNNHTVYIDDIVAIMRKSGLEISVVDDDVFDKKLNETLADDHLNQYITTLLAYGGHSSYVVNQPDQNFTIAVLNDMDWRWSITGSKYLEEVFDKLITLDYFDK